MKFWKLNFEIIFESVRIKLIFVESRPVSVSDSYRPVTLGVVVLYLRQFTDLFVSSVDKYKITLHKHQHINELTADDLKEVRATDILF